MSLTSLFLVILASLIHATWNLLAKKAANVGAVFVFAYNLFSALLQRMTAAADRRHCWRSGGEVEMMVEHFHSLGQGRWTYAESSLDQTHLSPDAGLNTPWAGLAFA